MPETSEERRSYWRGVLRRQGESGLSVRQFCANEKLSDASFYRWKRKIAGADSRRASNLEGGAGSQTRAGSGRDGRKHRQASRVAKPNGSTEAFIPVRLQAVAGGLLELVHPRGHVVRVPAAFDAGSLRQVLDVLDRQGGA